MPLASLVCTRRKLVHAGVRRKPVRVRGSAYSFVHPCPNRSMTAAKCILFAGQSNAQLCQHNGLTGATLDRVAVASSALGVNSGPYPFGWGPGDPYGFRVRLAAAFRAASWRVVQPAVVWWQGERDATAASDHYGPDLIELIGSMDTLFGRADVIWAVIRLNSAYALDGGGGDPATGTPLVRAGEAEAVAEYSSRATLIDIDDQALQADGHYLSAAYLTIWSRTKAAIATLTGDAAWNA